MSACKDAAPRGVARPYRGRPGFGFGKTLEHNLELLRRLRDSRANGRCLVGLSRKSMVGTLTGRSAGNEFTGASL